MVSVVNGYMCFSSCDVAKAEHNKNPRTPPGGMSDASKTASSADQPATTLSGALANLSPSSTGSVSAAASVKPSPHLVDIRV